MGKINLDSEAYDFSKIEENFSSLFHKADKVSQNSQKVYMRLFIGSIVLLVIAALLSTLSSSLVEYDFMNVLAAISIFTSLILTLLLFFTNHQKFWYDGRAIAESVKTLAWRYVTSSDPYGAHLNFQESKEEYLKDLEEIYQPYTEILPNLSLIKDDQIQVTSWMKKMRELPAEKKFEIYLENRIKSQKEWYREKANHNSVAKKWWFFAVFVVQGLAFFSIIFLFDNSELASSLTGLFATISAGVISWMQVRRFEELAQSYSVASNELSFIYEIHKDSDTVTQEKLSAYVADAENAISREHTLWIARRDKSNV